MAEWRDRGYVLDSDDEEESQSSLQSGHDASIQDRRPAGLAENVFIHNVPAGRGDSRPSDVEEDHTANMADSLSSNQVIKGNRDVPSPSLQNQQHGLGSLPVAEDAQITWDDGYGEVDELQQDQYAAKSCPSLRAEVDSTAVDFEEHSQSRHSTQDDAPSIKSVTSSPLSELSQIDQICTPNRFNSSQAGLVSSRSNSPLQQKPTHQIARFVRLTATEQTDVREPNKATRSLRNRKPMQLHPYTIEGEKYRQILKARGVKPLRIAQMEANATADASEESQIFEYQGGESQYGNEESQSRSQEVTQGDLTLSSSLPSQVSQLEPKQDNNMFIFGEDDLPDMQTLISNPARTYTNSGHKRRKVHAPTFRMPPGIHPTDHSRPTESLEKRALDNDDAMFDVPPSPPHSASETPSKLAHPPRPIFKAPQMTALSTLPTPVPSSEPRLAFIELSDEESPESSSEMDSKLISLSQSTDSEGDLSGDERSHQMQRAQRKIRGVLPASWLKLDFKNRSTSLKEHSRASLSESPEPKTWQRGVARPVSVKRGRYSDSPSKQSQKLLVDENDDDIASDENESVQHEYLRSTLTTEKGAGDEGFLDGRLGEASEDDRVDAMLPLATRSRTSNRKRRKRQTKLADFVSAPQSAGQKILRQPSGYRAHQKGHSTQPIKDNRKKPKFKPPRLSILDAPAVRQMSQTPMPHFIKIASRTVRSRYDKGRHSPSAKYLRLATEEDDRDAGETLSQWRKGIMLPAKPSASSHPITRQPLQPRSSNNAKPSRDFESSLEVEKLKPSYKHAPPKRRSIQSSLDHLVQRQFRDDADPPNVLPSQRYQEPSKQPKRQGQVVSSLRSSKDARPATLESLRENHDEAHIRTNFQQDLSRINRFDDESGLPNVLRLLQVNREHNMNADNASSQLMNHRHDTRNGSAEMKTLALRRHRKRRPQQFKVPILRSRESIPAEVVDDCPDAISISANVNGSCDKLIGLGPFGTKYTDTFDASPLPTGTCFHEGTFIGSGSFLKSLQLYEFDGFRGYNLFQHDGQMFRWGPWNDAVSSELGVLFDSTNLEIPDLSLDHDQNVIKNHEQGATILENVIAYFSDHLSFLDPIDRVSFLHRCQSLAVVIFLQLDGPKPPFPRTSGENRGASFFNLRLQCCALLVVLLNQMRQMAAHELVPPRLQNEVRSLTLQTARLALSLALSEGFGTFEALIADLKNKETTNYSIQEHQYPVEAFVIAYHTLAQDKCLRTEFWSSIQQVLPIEDSDGVFNVCTAERSWNRLFSLLPFLELDAQGVLETGRRFRVAMDDWALIKRMVSPVLNASLNNPRGQAPSFNTYCRALFGRCLHLINGWGWRRCELIVGTLFDFFARNRLANLPNKESHGSPLFLERLDKKPALVAESEDRCFHIFLKIVGSGLKHMHHTHPEKKVRDIVWRLMPNHGRSHPKEEALRQEDLDALRNHHDLLCLLYWAAPPPFRPRLTVVRDLVNLESSHREICHLNIRAWLNLVRFQLSTDESKNCLQGFAEWHDDLLAQILRQHGLARTEAEEQFRSLQYADGLTISNELLESNIARNQRQVQGILNDVLVSLKLAIDVAPSCEHVNSLVTPATTRIFELFEASRPQATKTIMKALDVISAYAKHFLPGSRLNALDANDDSQDYGDWSAFDENDMPKSNSAEGPASPLLIFLEPLRHLLSNCFGAEVVPEDALLSRIVDVWVAVAQILVRHCIKSWTDFLDWFGKESWSSLRDTEQTRKYTSYFLALLVEKDTKLFEDHREHFLKHLLGALVERESLLKFQNRLISALLNSNCDFTLLENLPFCTSKDTGIFQVTTAEFSEGRLSLISSILSNMRVSLEGAVFKPHVNAASLKQEYKNLLKHMMATMKRNYEELGHGSNVRGAYVDFVHKVVEFFQHYTSNICPIDRFFTDNGAFPLPAADPTYVVGQLKNYALRLQDPRTPKQLTVFLQSVSERAAADGQQGYLVGQLYAAISNSFEDSTNTRPSLRAFIVRVIFPAYIDLGFKHDCGWILALPYLQALQKDFNEILVDLDGLNADSITSVTSIITAFFDAVPRSLRIVAHSNEIFQKTNTLIMLKVCFQAITAILPILDYLTRLSGATQRALEDLTFLQVFAEYAYSALEEPDGQHITPEVEDIEESTPDETQKFVLQELEEALAKKWSRHGPQYYILTGSSRREVLVDIGLYEEEKALLKIALERFWDCLSVMPTLNEGGDATLDTRKEGITGLGGLVF